MVSGDLMVKEIAAQAPEIISVTDLLVNKTSSPQSDDGIARIENLLKLADKGIGMLDKGITITGKFQNIVENVTGVIHHKMAVQQQPAALKQAPEPAPLQGDPSITLTIQGTERILKTADIQNYVFALEKSIQEKQQEPTPQALGVSTETILQLLRFLVETAPNLTVEQLIELIQDNKDTLDKLIKNPQTISLLKLGSGFLKAQNSGKDEIFGRTGLNNEG